MHPFGLLLLPLLTVANPLPRPLANPNPLPFPLANANANPLPFPLANANANPNPLPHPLADPFPLADPLPFPLPLPLTNPHPSTSLESSSSPAQNPAPVPNTLSLESFSFPAQNPAPVPNSPSPESTAFSTPPYTVTIACGTCLLQQCLAATALCIPVCAEAAGVFEWGRCRACLTGKKPPAACLSCFDAQCKNQAVLAGSVVLTVGASVRG